MYDRCSWKNWQWSTLVTQGGLKGKPADGRNIERYSETIRMIGVITAYF